MQKSTAAFRTISEVADTLGLQTHVLRFWESKFTQIKPVKRGGGRRYYRPEDVALIRGIQHYLHEEGMTIKGAQKTLRESGIKSVIDLGKSLLDGHAEPAPEAANNRPAPIPPVDRTPRADKQARIAELVRALSDLRGRMAAGIREQ